MRYNYYIYTLSNSRGRIYYVGVTRSPKNRFAFHKMNSRGRAKISIIQTVFCTYQQALNLEKETIISYFRKGINLENKVHSDWYPKYIKKLFADIKRNKVKYSKLDDAHKIKKSVFLTLTPANVEKARKRAIESGLTLSELVDNMLFDYAE